MGIPQSGCGGPGVKLGSHLSTRLRARAGLIVLSCGLTLRVAAQIPDHAVNGILKVLDAHSVVGLGELRQCKQQLEFYRGLFGSPEFSEKRIDLVVEFGNALYQPTIDRYMSGAPVPQGELAKVWQNTTGLFSWDSPLYAQFFTTARDANLKLPKERRFRIVLGDPPVEWDKVRTREDLGPYITHRHDHFAKVLVEEVLARKRKALAITGFFHMLRGPNGPSEIEKTIQAAHSDIWLMLAGSDVLGAYNDAEPRFSSWPRPGLLSVRGSWLGSRDAGLVLDPSRPSRFPGKFQEYADGYLYLGPRDSITRVPALRSYYEGTPYGREVARRLQLMYGLPLDFDKIPTDSVNTAAEEPYYSPAAKAVPFSPPPPPKSAGDPLPPGPKPQGKK
jgi:hypothetical protein